SLIPLKNIPYAPPISLKNKNHLPTTNSPFKKKIPYAPPISFKKKNPLPIPHLPKMWLTGLKAPTN
ncbi:hypothetical protein, partial [Thiolapillus sp.]|uniref:hypothetical protein n=1 Tax=Thiolapillus sp. TaxID=2017437 RepID=UPI003AF5953F